MEICGTLRAVPLRNVGATHVLLSGAGRGSSDFDLLLRVLLSSSAIFPCNGARGAKVESSTCTGPEGAVTAEHLRKPAAAVLLVVHAAPLNSDALPLKSCTGVVVVRMTKGCDALRGARATTTSKSAIPRTLLLPKFHAGSSTHTSVCRRVDAMRCR